MYILFFLKDSLKKEKSCYKDFLSIETKKYNEKKIKSSFLSFPLPFVFAAFIVTLTLCKFLRTFLCLLHSWYKPRTLFYSCFMLNPMESYLVAVFSKIKVARIY